MHRAQVEENIMLLSVERNIVLYIKFHSVFELNPWSALSLDDFNVIFQQKHKFPIEFLVLVLVIFLHF